MKYVLEFLNVRGSIEETEMGFWRWAVTYSDGSGLCSDWTLTLRAAKRWAADEARGIAHNYTAKLRWKKQV